MVGTYPVPINSSTLFLNRLLNPRVHRQEPSYICRPGVSLLAAQIERIHDRLRIENSAIRLERKRLPVDWATEVSKTVRVPVLMRGDRLQIDARA